eukprot:Gb_28845 [translate_table: standard]
MDSCSGHGKDSCRDSAASLKLKLIAIAAILVGSFIGLCIPIVARSCTYFKVGSRLFFLVKAFAGGVILAAGFVHVLPDAFESLTSQCLAENPWSQFPFAGFVAMIAALITLFVDVSATVFSEKLKIANEAPRIADQSQGGHSDGKSPFQMPLLLLLWRGIVLLRRLVLDIGIMAHSVIIGISFGTSERPCTIRPLVAALTFHQFFEGMGLGGSIAQAEFRSKASVAMAILFSFTTPLGIAVGMGISSMYKKNILRAMVVEGLLNSASAGILIYMALVDLIATDFLSNNTQSVLYRPIMKFWGYLAVVCGAGCMSLLAYAV